MNASPSTDTPTVNRTAPIALWRVAEVFMRTLFGLFGSPKDIAYAHTLTAKTYNLTRTWLRVAEAVLRRLLLIEAAAHESAPFAKSRRRHQSPRKLIELDPNKPESWRVSLHCFYGPPAPSPACGVRVARQPTPIDVSADLSHMTSAGAEKPLVDTGARPAFDKPSQAPIHSGASLNLSKRVRATRRFRDAWPLARRYEALVRAFNNPAPFARRLALRLRREPQRATELLRAPPDANHKIGEKDFVALTAAAHAAAPAAPNSS